MRQGSLLLEHPGHWDNCLSPNVDFESCKSLEKKRLEISVLKEFKFAILNFVPNKTVLSVMFRLIDVAFNGANLLPQALFHMVTDRVDQLTVQSTSNLPILAKYSYFEHTLVLILVYCSNLQVKIEVHPCIVFPLALMLVRSFRQVRSTSRHFFRRVHVATPRCDRLRECFLFFFSFVTSVLVIRGNGSAVVFVHHGDHLLLLFERNQTIRDSAKGSVLLDRCLFSDLYT